MGKKLQISVIIAMMIVISGCIQPPLSLGCCLKANATDQHKCVLFNADTTRDFPPPLTIGCGGGFCNVTVSTGVYTIPICTEDQDTGCSNAACTALVCGDFKYAPTIPIDIEGTSTPQPSDTGAETTIQFFKGQCIPLQVDNHFKRVLKTAKAKVDVFRFGVGGSFDEFEQARYFFPVSDKFCNINPPRSTSDLRIDRYMNYMGAGNVKYNPIAKITGNCVDDVNNASAWDNSPISYTEDTSPITTGFTEQGGPQHAVQTKTPVPEVRNYIFSKYVEVDDMVTGGTCGTGGETGSDCTPSGGSYFGTEYKKLDVGAYFAGLTNLYADDINGYQKTIPTTRAPFECDLSSNDCYSGFCDTTLYRRDVMLTTDGNEVTTGCEHYYDSSSGRTILVCEPLTDISGSTRTFAGVDGKTVWINSVMRDDYLAKTDDLFRSPNYRDNICWIRKGSLYTDVMLDYMGDNQTLEETNNVCRAGDGPPMCLFPITCTGPAVGFSYDMSKNLDVAAETRAPVNIPYDLSGNKVANAFSDDTQPPAGGILFFGNIQGGMGGQPQYQKTPDGPTRDVIGYALVDPSEVGNLLLVKNCGMVEGTDYDIIEVPDNPKDWQPLQNDFAGYVLDKIKDLQYAAPGDACANGKGQTNDDTGPNVYAYSPNYILGGVPWVISMYKSDNLADLSASLGASPVPDTNVFLLTSEIARALRNINRYGDYSKTTAAGDTCALRDLIPLTQWEYPTGGDPKHTIIKGWGFATVDDPRGTANFHDFYGLYFAKHIVVFYGDNTDAADPSKKVLGRCEIDGGSGLPKTRTFGWCEPCSTSTLAYQKITAGTNPYRPVLTQSTSATGAINTTTLCTQRYSSAFGEDNPALVCEKNPFIEDMPDYNGLELMRTGTPRTIPSAAMIKDRLGTYMKQGIMPVIDISDPSNWDLDNPFVQMDCTSTCADAAKGRDACPDCQKCDLCNANPDESGCINKDNPIVGVCARCTSCVQGNQLYCEDCLDKKHYTTYDFLPLFSKTGAMVVIVNQFSFFDFSNPDAFRARVFDTSFRSKLVRDNCAGCLVGYQVVGVTDNITFLSVASAVQTQLAAIGAQNQIDLITFDYNINPDAQLPGHEKDREAAADDLLACAQSSLFLLNRTSMVVGLRIADVSGGDELGLQDTLDRIFRKQTDLVAAGSMGIIYAPERNAKDDLYMYGLETENDAGLGVKGPKFCALQQAMADATTLPPLTIFNKVSVTRPICGKCTSLELATGVCTDKNGLNPAMKCDDGGYCALPTEETEFWRYKCPADTFTPDCSLCNKTVRDFTCTRIYTNGSVDTFNGSTGDIASDMYMDVMAGLPKGQKCCVDSNNDNHSFVKMQIPQPNNNMLAFSHDQNANCDFGNVAGLGDLGLFCGIDLPIKEYDIKCALKTGINAGQPAGNPQSPNTQQKPTTIQIPP